MRRKAEKFLDQWKNQKNKQPLLIDGARQVGKTYLVKNLWGPGNFKKIHVFDFKQDKTLHELFEESLEPDKIIKNTHLNY